ncbi:ion transporter [Lactobacillus terrae]|uniref:ion transporter n=1 Tax=Lactobacillus terrae TaxID=2269374 RepID=UPI000C1B6EE7|nr:ion transporter [Lactobacillus terrae]
MNKKKSIRENIVFKYIYFITTILLALVSIILLILDYSGKIDLNKQPYFFVDQLILVIFTVDYIVRFIISKNKKQFFRKNIFELLAILPFSTIFYSFRLVKIFRFAKFLQLNQAFQILRIFGFLGKFQKSVKRFLNTNGFIYIMIAGIILMCFSAIVYSYVENIKLSTAFWWAIVTTTTVGYGDVVPHTGIGRFVSAILMIIGISFLGIITSAITNFVTNNETEKSDEKIDKVIEKLESLENQNAKLEKELSDIKSKIDK